jgi:transcriptional regulator CtsR
MPSLSDFIERHIKEMLQLAGTIELSRQKMAEHFECAPSQINYVLETRFTGQHGYVVESRRGGGGFIRVTRVTLASLGDAAQEIIDAIGAFASEATAESVIRRLIEDELLSPREAALMRAATRREVLRLPLPDRDVLRAAMLKAMLFALVREGPRSD